MSASNALAATEWSAEPRVMWQSQHNTNPYLIHAPERTVTTHRLDLNIPVSGESELVELNVEPQLHFIRNPHWSELDRNEYGVGVGASRMMELGNVGVKGDYTRDTTLTSELLDTGYVGAKKQRNLWSMEPYLNMQLSPAINLMTGLKYKKQNYQDAGATPLVGYEYAQASVALSHEIDDRGLVRCGVDHSRMRTERATSDDMGVYCSWEREMAEPLHGSLMLGGHRTSSVRGAGAESRSGTLAALDLSYETENVHWGVRGGRSVEPSGYGVLVRTDQLGLTAAYNLNEYLWASAGISVNRYVTTIPAYDLPGNLPGRDYDVVNWRVAWRWLPEWVLEGGIDYARQHYDNELSYASATTLIVQLAYRSASN